MKKSTLICLSNLVVLILLLTGCTAQSEKPEQNISSTPSFFFPVQLDKYIGTPYPETLAIGTLALDDGYLRLKPLSNTGNSSLLIWPPGFSARVDGNDVYVRDRDGTKVAHMGDKIRISGGHISSKTVETYTGHSLPVQAAGPYWLVGYVVSPAVLALPPTSVPASTANISREQAIQIASNRLPTSIVSRAEIKAEFHVWYWEVTFGDLNAMSEELEPWPLRGSPPLPPGRITTQPYPDIWQSVIITIDAQTGKLKSASARKAPVPGPYISQEQATNNAMSSILETPSDMNLGIDITWFEKAQVEIYLRGDVWVVLFWEDGSTDNHFSVTIDAITGETSDVNRR